VVGDLDGNVTALLAMLDRAEAAGCDLAVFPELAVTGYPPEDLLLKPGFVADNLASLEKLAARTGRCAAIVGFVDRTNDLHNAAAVCAHGQVQGVYHKRLLPNYAVFDEQRYFAPGQGDPVLFVIGGVRVGVSICEDIWSPNGPASAQAAGGAELVVNLNASPYYAGRLEERERMLGTRAADASCSLVYVNQVGGQDELVFDGASLVVDASGAVLARAPQFVEDVMVVDLDVRPSFRKRLLDPRGRASSSPLAQVTVTGEAAEHDTRVHPTCAEPLAREREIYEALVLGTRDYVAKNGFNDVVEWTRRSSPPSPSTRSGPSTCTGCRCRRATPARAHVPTRPGWPTSSASTSARSPSSPPTGPSSRCSHPRSRPPTRASRRRTCRRVRAASP